MKKIEKMQSETIVTSGYAYPSIDPLALQGWMKDLTFLNGFSYGFTPEGDLIPLDDANLIRVAHENGVEPIMSLVPLNDVGEFSNELVKQLLDSPEAQERLLNNVLATIKAKNLFGVDFDFEYVYAANRDAYTNFITTAAERFNREGYIVTVALAPKVSADQKGLLYEGHDYEGIGQGANFVLIMTYEWGYTFGPPRAVAPANEVRKVLDYGVTAIPPEKILMGIPNYGYDWVLPFVAKESRAEKISNPDAVARAAQYGVEIQYDETAQSPYYYYNDESGREHVVWFEDARSMRAKLALIREYGLAGAGYWNIMDLFPAGSAVLNEMYDIEKIVEEQ